MIKQVKVKDVPIKEIFYLHDSKYIRYNAYYVNGYHSNLCMVLALAVSSSNNGSLLVLSENDIVNIEVQELTFEDIKVGEEFTVHGVKYTKLKHYNSEKSFALVKDTFRAYDLNDDALVERI